MTSIPASMTEHTGWVLLHSVWQFAAIATLILVGTRLLQQAPASARYMLLLAGLLLMTLTPAVTWFVLPEPVPVAELLQEVSEPLDEFLLVTADVTAPEPFPAFDPQTNTPSGPVEGLTPAPAADSFTAPLASSIWHKTRAEFLKPWLSTIVVLWCAGVLLFSIRPLWSWLNIRRLQRIGTTLAAESVQAAVRRIAGRLQVTRQVNILASTVVTSPIVVGCFQGVILLPASFIANVPTSQLEAILAHELAHVRRYDYLVNLLQTLIETLFFYHPAIWWISHRIRIERENCCDDLVVSTFANKVEYGRALLAVEEFRSTAAASSALALSVKGGSLLDRIRRLAREPSGHARRNSAGPVAVAVILVCFVIGGVWLSTQAGADEAATSDETPVVSQQPGKKKDVDVSANSIAVPLPKSYAVELPHGQTIEFVGIRKSRSAAADWWSPDGRKHGKAYSEWGTSTNDYGEIGRDFLVFSSGFSRRPSMRFEVPTIGHGTHTYYERQDSPVTYLSGALIDYSQISDPSRLPEPATAKVWVTDEPWGKWLQVDPDGSVLNPMDDSDAFVGVYNQIRFQPTKDVVRAKHSPALQVFHPGGGSPIYDFQFRAWTSDGKECRLANDLMQERKKDAPKNPAHIYSPREQLPDGVTLSHFEFRLRPYRYLVTFENIVTDGPNEEPSQVKTSVQTLANGDEKRGLTAGRFPSATTSRSGPSGFTPSLIWFHSANHVHFVLYHEGFLQTGVSYSELSDPSGVAWKWKFDGKVNALAGTRTVVDGKKVWEYRRTYPLSFRFDPPDLALRLDGMTFNLAEGRVLVLGKSGTPIQLSLQPPSIEDRRDQEALTRFKKRVDDALKSQEPNKSGAASPEIPEIHSQKSPSEGKQGAHAKGLDRAKILATFAQQLRAAAPDDWTVDQKERAFRLLGPETTESEERARILMWFDDVSISSSDLDKRDKSAMDIGHLDNTQLGRLYITRNKAAVKLWGHAYTAVRKIEPVDHIAFADLDNLRGVSWSDAASVRDVNIDSQGRLQRLLGSLSETNSGITPDTKFLVIGRIPKVTEPSSESERRIAEKFAANLELLKSAAAKHTVPVISIAEFAAHTKRRLAEGRGFPTRWAKDANRIQPPDCLLTGEGLRMVEQR